MDAIDAKQAELDKLREEYRWEISGLHEVLDAKDNKLDKAHDLIRRMREWIDSTTISHYSMGIGTVEQRTTNAQGLMFEAETITREG